MGLFKKESIMVDVPVDKAQAVFEKITGEYGKLVRESYDRFPFTGTIKPGRFSITPNMPNMAVKLKGTFASEGIGTTRVTIEGRLVFGKLLFAILIGAVLIPSFAFIIYMLFTDEGMITPSIGVAMIIIAILSSAFFGVFGFPNSRYKQSIYELMRKLDNHDVVI